MNKVILMGRLTKAPEIKDLQDDNKTAMARYTLAVERRYGKDREISYDTDHEYIYLFSVSITETLRVDD